MKKIIIKNKQIGSGIKYIGWSGRGWIDGGPAGAGPINCNAPSWESYGQEIGINMVRMGFSIKHFLSSRTYNKSSVSEQIKNGLENVECSWAKSERTSYSYAIQRCCDQGWKILICINPSYGSCWDSYSITASPDSILVWKDFCFHLTKSIQENWPGMAQYFEITNEPDIGYFDGESLLPYYKGPSGGITPSQYSLLLENASQAINKVMPEAKIIGPALARWDQNWIKEILTLSPAHLDGLSYHNVRGTLNDEKIVKEAKNLSSQYSSRALDLVFNSEWAWWPDHDIDHLKTALRIAQILYLQTKGGVHGSFYLGPAQPKNFKKGLGVIKFDPNNPNRVERTKTFFAFRLMVRGVLGEKKMELINPFQKLKILALVNHHTELIITIINPTRKKFKNLSLIIDESINIKKEPFLKLYQFDYNHNDSCEKTDHRILKKFNLEPESITQFVV